MPTWKNIGFLHLGAIFLLVASTADGAGLDSLSKAKSETPAAANTTVETKQSTAPEPTETTISPPKKPTAVVPPAPAATSQEKKSKPETGEKEASTADQEEKKSQEQPSKFSKLLVNRLSLSAALGWASVRPSSGSWSGIGASHIAASWRESRLKEGFLFITARYTPMTGVWSLNSRDYDTALHGIYTGVEYQNAIESMGAPTIKAGAELGYVLVYASPQDKAKAADDVKESTFNLAVNGGLDWPILDKKIKVGPFARYHLAGFSVAKLVARRRTLQTQSTFVPGFSIFNVGGSISFVF